MLFWVLGEFPAATDSSGPAPSIGDFRFEINCYFDGKHVSEEAIYKHFGWKT